MRFIHNFKEYVPSRLKFIIIVMLVLIIVSWVVQFIYPAPPRDIIDLSTRSGTLLMGFWVLSKEITHLGFLTLFTLIALGLRPTLADEDSARPENKRREISKNKQNMFDAEDEEDERILSGRTSSKAE